MKNHIAIITGIAGLAVANLGSAQPLEATAPPEAAPVTLVQDVLTGIGASSAGRALIIPKEDADPKDFAEIEEDLNVMARILEKAAGGRDEQNRHAMGIAVYTSFIGAPQSLKNLRIEGYGALFFLNVNFPLLPPPTKAQEAEAKDKTSTEWEAARRELYRPPGAGFDLGVWKAQTLGDTGAEYDADKVEDLKRDLIAALKNAAHIRQLKSDETVTVVVSGRGPGAGGKYMKRVTWPSGGGGGIGDRTPLAITKAASDGQGTRLILRARKADIDAFQKDQTSLEDFRKKVTAIVY
jgi:hypothetical protein